MAEPLLDVRSVTAGYYGRAVLRAVSLKVEEGQVVGIIGPNGHGKTTLLACISGLLPLSAGEIRFAGTSLKGKSVEKIVEAGIVHIPQGDMIFPDMTVRENLLMGAYLPSANAKAVERLEAVHQLFPTLVERRNQIASTLSGGERRMVGIGRGMMSGGRILLIDEPSLGLAPIVIEQIYKALASLKAQGNTLLVVEENASRAMRLADQLYLLDHGEVVWEGAPGDLRMHKGILETYLGA
jgi:branched-chain amino acid transport system ATP-binding protein